MFSTELFHLKGLIAVTNKNEGTPSENPKTLSICKYLRWNLPVLKTITNNCDPRMLQATCVSTHPRYTLSCKRVSGEQYRIRMSQGWSRFLNNIDCPTPFLD